MMPSDMDLYIGTINGYNNLITIATDDLQLGFNDTINEEQQIQQYQFESPQDDFELVPDDPALQLQQEESMNKEELQQEESMNKEELQQEESMNKDELQQEESMNKEELQQEESMNKEELQQEESVNKEKLQQEEQRSKNKEKLTHEENKLLLTLLGITLGSVAIWIFN